MTFGHEQMDVYRAAIEYVSWAYQLCKSLKGHRNAKDQLIRASQAIPLNIAEGNGKATRPLTGIADVFSRLPEDQRWNVLLCRTYFKSAGRCGLRIMPKQRNFSIGLLPC